MTGPDRPSIAERLRNEQAKIRKLQIIFGRWWPHYAVPYELRWTLWAERRSCLYCSIPLAPPDPGLDSDADIRAGHIDHMDPLSMGGEESFRNAVYACAHCNSAKGNRLFVNWLATLPEPHRALARRIYEEKHGHDPEAFTQGSRQPRLTLDRLELELDEAVLRQLYRKPVVSGPPRALK